MQKLYSYKSYGGEDDSLNNYIESGWIIKSFHSCLVSPNNAGVLITVLLEKSSE